MSEKHFLEDFRYIISEEGVIRDQTGEVYGNNTGTPKDNAQFAHDRAVASEGTQEDTDGYEERRYSDESFPVIQAEMRNLIAAGLVSPEDAEQIASNPKRFNEEYDALRNRMVGAEVDRPRTDAIAALRRQLRVEDELTGGRRTTRRAELEMRILSLHGPGR